MTEDRLIGSFPKNSRESIHATLRSYKGLQLADIRVWTSDDEDRDIPTRKGLSIQVRDLGKLRALIDALIEAAKGQPS